MPAYIEKAEPVTLPVIALRGTVAFPQITINFEAGDESAATAAKAAAASSSFLFLTSYNEYLEGGEEKEFPFYRVGTVVRIKQMLRTPEGQTRIIAEGLVRATVNSYRTILGYTEADLICRHVTLPDMGGVRGEAAVNEMLRAAEQNMRLLPAESGDLLNTIRTIKDPGALADFIAAHILVRPVDKQAILECIDPFARAEILLSILAEEAVVMEEESRIRKRVSARMNRHQKEYYLREQIKVIQEELGEGDDVAEFAERIQNSELPEEVAAKLTKENDRLAKTPFGSAEATVLANYLDTCLSIPWSKTTKDRVSFTAVQKVLDADHNGLEEVKERIVEYIAAKQLNPDLNNQILCLVGPPGVGKTSIASSIARAMNRKYVRISLGGVRDEADIRGHRKTYIGAMPGRIITALTQAEVRNPLILLDEIDKLTRDSHGDPTSALLEVLDGEQNKSFRDHFVELPFDLSDCMFIATANSLENIPKPLIDRMEIIELSTYTKREKLEIAKDHLIPKQLKRHGMTKRMLRITEDALIEIIDYYTREAGVRSLERTIATLCRKTGKKMLETGCKSITVKSGDVKTYLGERKLLPESIDSEDPVGCVNGLAYTELGGSLLKVEVAVLDGTGKIETTGSLGEVMKESAQIAVSYVRSVAKEFGIPTDFYKTKDIHIHFPEGAIPKDGPSAGVTMVTALISALTGRAVRRDVAMTGEISLRGNVLAIGGLKEKTMAAYSAGVKTVLIPEENMRDLSKIDTMARDNLQFIPCRRAADVLKEALLPAKKTAPTEFDKSADAVAASTFVPTANIQPQVRL
ncbi:MAG: endopeptidase La [Ruminococcaceae bacterium]|nr:endopeptidase La [Oscillospiraceae bacterium]